MMELFDTIEQHAVSLVVGGLALLAAVFVLSFFYRTCWSQWKDRARDKQIYGEPRNRKSHLMRDDETD